MEIAVYELTEEEEDGTQERDGSVQVKRLWPDNEIANEGLDCMSSLPPLPAQRVFAIELWPHGPNSEKENDFLKTLDAAGLRYVANEHHGFFYSFAILTSGGTILH